MSMDSLSPPSSLSVATREAIFLPSFSESTMTISSANSYTDIDCDIMDAFKGSTNCNGNISGSFPTLAPGDNTVDLPSSGITKIEIIPRWWVL